MNAIVITYNMNIQRTYIHILMLINRTHVQDTHFKMLGETSRENLKREPTLMCDLDVLIKVR